ncbi:MAG: tyrosine-type recombinase/integrase [Planctomycetota bacterium]
MRERRTNHAGAANVYREPDSSNVHPIDRHDLDRYVAKRLTMQGKKTGDSISPETVKKELRYVRTALNRAREWNYLKTVPGLPKVLGYGKDKAFMLEEDFDAILKACDKARLPDPRIRHDVDRADWWRALLATLWICGTRIGAALQWRWNQLDSRGTVLSLATQNKGKRDMRHDISAAVPMLEKIRTTDPRLFPWNHHRRTLDREFHRIQWAAGIHLECLEEHEHTPECHVYGFHDVRRAHATYNYGTVPDEALQQQMGHASFQTTRDLARRRRRVSRAQKGHRAGPKRRV